MNKSDDIELPPWIEVYVKDIDRTLIRENLKLSYEERVAKYEDMQRFIAQAHRWRRERLKKNARHNSGSAD